MLPTHPYQLYIEEDGWPSIHLLGQLGVGHYDNRARRRVRLVFRIDSGLRVSAREDND